MSLLYYSLNLQATKKRNYKPVAIGKKNVIKQGQNRLHASIKVWAYLNVWKKASYIWVAMYLAWKCGGHYFYISHSKWDGHFT